VGRRFDPDRAHFRFTAQSTHFLNWIKSLNTLKL
jgi:hypothetical protein